MWNSNVCKSAAVSVPVAVGAVRDALDSDASRFGRSVAKRERVCESLRSEAGGRPLTDKLMAGRC